MIKYYKMQGRDSVNILIVGLGLIGGSYAKGLKEKGYTVYGVDVNEKTIEYSSEFSNDILKLEGVQFPTLNFDVEEVTFERIKGTINIDDIGNSIKLGEESKILVTYKDSTGNTPV